MKKLIYALLAVLLLAGCNKQDSVIHSGIEAGTLSSGVFTSDYGTKMNVVGNEGKYDVSSTRRVLINYETHPITDPQRIDIDLLGLLDAGILLPDPVDTISDTPEGSPLTVSDAWFGGGYLNILVTYAGKDPSVHVLTATEKVDQDGIVIQLHHDDGQDSISGTEILSLFLSVPISDPLFTYEQISQSNGKKQPYPVTFRLQWTGRTLENGPLTLYERKGTYTPPTEA